MKNAVEGLNRLRQSNVLLLPPGRQYDPGNPGRFLRSRADTANGRICVPPLEEPSRAAFDCRNAREEPDQCPIHRSSTVFERPATS